MTERQTNWERWHQIYDISPPLQARRSLVSHQIGAALDECPAGSVTIVSACAGDGRDVIAALREHARRDDVTGWLLDRDTLAVDRGAAAAAAAGLGEQCRFVLADATLAKSYAGMVPAHVIVVSGFLGRLSSSTIPAFVDNLRMLCRCGGCVIWSKHLTLNHGSAMVPLLRESLGRNAFEEVQFETTNPEGYAVGRARFVGDTVAFDRDRVFFTFIR